MIQEIKNEKYGTIAYEESLLTGKKNVYFNGVQAQKTGKNTFVIALKQVVDGEVKEETVAFTLSGSLLSGVNLVVGCEVITIIPKSKWYEYVFYFLPFALVMVWGNSVELCQIVPIIGGAIGGFISALFSIIAIVFSKRTKNVLFKVLIGLASLVATFIVCALVASMLLSAIQ